MHALVALALLAASSKTAPKPKPAPILASTGGGMSVAIDPAAARTQARTLGLNAALQDRVEKYAKAADAVAKGGTDGAVCSLVDEANSLGADIRSAITKDGSGLESAAPGLRLSDAKGGANYEVLGRLVLSRHASAAALLSGAGGMLDRAHPAYVVMKDAERGCTDYSRSQSSIDKIVTGWKAAPSCLKDKLKQPLNTALGDDPLATCWCQDSDNAAFAAKHYAARLSTLKEFDGPTRAKSIMAEVEDASAHFSCNAN